MWKVCYTAGSALLFIDHLIEISILIPNILQNE